MPAFKQRQKRIEAIQFTGLNAPDVHNWSGCKDSRVNFNGKQLEATHLTLYLDGFVITLSPTDWLIRRGDIVDWMSDKQFTEEYEPDETEPGVGRSNSGITAR